MSNNKKPMTPKAVSRIQSAEARTKEGANKSPNIKMRPCKYLNLMN
ncbi:hypothetical protein ACK35F_06645 [Aeromonas veronii]